MAEPRVFPRGAGRHAGEPAPRPFMGMSRVEPVMGTMVGIDVRDPVGPAILDDAFAYLHAIDARFSPYRPDSEISRLARGELDEAACGDDVRLVLALCDDFQRTTGGYFDARRHRLDGRLDPSGLVKGWSVEEASLLIEAAGARNFAINAGGDIIAAGEREPDRPWRIGIRHPGRIDRLAVVLAVRDAAVATSGAYERGAHILDPHTGRPPRALQSITVVGPSLTYADVYATTAFAMGPEGPAWVASHAGYGAFGVTADDRVVWTPLMERFFA